MKLFAHGRHVYEDRGRRVFLEWAPGQVHDVPDGIGALLLETHAAKFCDVSKGSGPEAHRCRKRTEIYITEQLKPEATTMLVPGSGRVSKQRLATRRETYKRSRVARVNPAARG